MPFRSEKQREFMWAKHPDIARRWTEKYGPYVRPTKKKKRKKSFMKPRKKEH